MGASHKTRKHCVEHNIICVSKRARQDSLPLPVLQPACLGSPANLLVLYMWVGETLQAVNRPQVFLEANTLCKGTHTRLVGCWRSAALVLSKMHSGFTST